MLSLFVRDIRAVYTCDLFKIGDNKACTILIVGLST